jgi:hypothetical protein
MVFLRFEQREVEKGYGRIYRGVAFEATDGEGTCQREVSICVPHHKGHPLCVDGGDYVDSTVAGKPVTTETFVLRGKGHGGKPVFLG